MLRKGTAVVTPQGIEFMTRYYSCQTALKLNWFELAADEGSWEISIFYVPINLDYIYIYSSRDQTINCIAYKLNKIKPNVKEKSEYYKRFNKLKLKRSIKTLKILYV